MNLIIIKNMIVPYVDKKVPDFKEIEKILEPSIKSNIWSNNGQIKQELENYLHRLLELDQNKAVICVSSATSGLHLLLMYYEYICNRELKFLSTSYTFPSLVTNNAKNITLIDIDKDTYNIPQIPDISDYDGFILNNLFGTYCSDLDFWINYCRDNNKILIFDNASSALSKREGINICNFGDSSIISFHPTKYISGPTEGGAIVIDKDKYDIINSMTNFGFNNNRKYNKFSSNFKMDEISAAIQLNHIKNYDLKKHKDNQRDIYYEIKDIPNVKIFNYIHNGEVLGNLPVLFDKPIDNRDFKDLGIEVNKYYLPLNENHKNSMELYSRICNFPLYSNISYYQIDFMVKQIKNKALTS